MTISAKDFERKFINKLLSLDSLSAVSRAWFTEAYLKEESTRYAYEVIYNYYKNLSKGQIPTREYLVEKLESKWEVDENIQVWNIEDEPLSIEAIIEELKEAHLWSRIVDLFREVHSNVTNKVPSNQIFSLIKQKISEIEASNISEMSVKKFTDIKERITEYNEKLKDDGFNENLIKYPFDKLNERYHWIKESNLIFIVAPQKTGKTFILNEFALSAFRQRKRVLFISPEMSSNEIFLRMDWFFSNMFYKKMDTWTLSDKEMEDWVKSSEELMQIKEEGWEIHIVDWKWENISFDSVVGFVEYYKPELVIIDGLGLLVDENSKDPDWLKFKNISRNIKRDICNKLWIPCIVAVHATNDEDSMNSEILQPHQVGRSKKILEDVDVAFGLSNPKEKAWKWEHLRVLNTLAFRDWVNVLLALNFDIDKGRITFNEKVTNELLKEYKEFS